MPSLRDGSNRFFLSSGLCFSKYGPWTSSMSNTWTFIKNAGFQPYPGFTEGEAAFSTSCLTLPQGWPHVRITRGGLENPRAWIYPGDSDLIDLSYGLGACVSAYSLQSCGTLCDPMDCSLPGSSMGFFRQEYWSGLPCPPPGDLLNPGVEPGASLMSPALASGFFTTSATYEALQTLHPSLKTLLQSNIFLKAFPNFSTSLIFTPCFWCLKILCLELLIVLYWLFAVQLVCKLLKFVNLPYPAPLQDKAKHKIVI